jgi:class 3 adenylate cyclase/DNA-binding CsgD family transcriptional regulator/tetratricopeptide (TPR) repeat protein
MVAILFTDLVGSTELLDRLGDAAADDLRQTHFALLRQAVSETGGQDVKSLGDGLMVVVPSPVEVLHCAVAMQRAIAEHNERHPERSLQVRVGVHIGDPLREEGDFFGTAVAVAQRMCGRAGAGQILASELLADVAGTRGPFQFRRLGPLRLKGLSEPVTAVSVEWVPTLSAAASRSSAPSSIRGSRPPVPRGPRLVGREQELAILESELSQTAEGEFHSVLLLGEPGVGKTRLAGEFLSRHAQQSVTLVGRAYPFGQTASFGLWSEALERHLRELSVHEVVGVCGGFLDDLAGLLRSVAAARGSVPEGEPPRFRLLDGLAVLLSNLAREAPLIVHLDDVHLADASSWETLLYLARNLSATPMLAILAARPGELFEQPPAVEVVPSLEQEGQLKRLIVHPVGRSALAELSRDVLQVPPPEALVEWLTERSRGNPLFALGLLEALVDEGGDLSAPHLSRLPDALSDRVARNLQRLGQADLATVEGLAVVARPVDLAELGRLCGQPPDQLAGIVHRLIRSGLVQADQRGLDVSYELAHPLLQELIYARIGPPRQRILHRFIARTLLAAGRLGEAAPHFARSAETGDTEAIDALRDALRQTEERRAHLEGLAILTTLVELLPLEDERWLQVIDAISSRADWWIDRRVEVGGERAMRAMRRMDSMLERSPDLARRAAIKYRLARFLAWGAGELEEAARLCERARDLFEQAGDQKSMLVVAGELAYIHSLRGEWDTLDAEVERVISGAEAAGDRPLAMGAIAASGRTSLWRGRFSEAEATFERLAALAREEGNLDHLTFGLGSLVLTRAFAGRILETGPPLEAAKALTEAWRDSMFVAWEIGVRWLAGDFGGAMAGADELLALHPQGLSRRRAIGLVFAGLAATEGDQTARAHSYLRRASAAYSGPGWQFYSHFLEHAEVVLAVREGSLDYADRLRQPAWALAKVVPFLAALALADVAEIAAQIGGAAGRTTAHEAAARLDSVAQQAELAPLYRGLAALAWSASHLAAGEVQPAVGRADEAVALLTPLGYRAFLGRALLLLGRARAGTDSRQALAAFEAAGAAFEACGAVWRREHALTAMRALGSRGRKRAVAGSGPGALTPREREVARLAAEGHSAREIAAQLFVGERTVEGYLASIYAKLGVASKLDLVRRAAELGF